MHRRTFLAGLTVGTVGLAGCTGPAAPFGETETSAPESVDAPSLAEQGNPSTICQQGYVDLGIYAIDKPAFADDWGGVEIPKKYTGASQLAEDDVVVGLVTDGMARAYPVAVLWVHEIVNDTFGEPVIVTFCSICRSGMTASRVVNRTPTTFGVSGQLWQPPELESRVRETEGSVFAVERRNTSPGEIRNLGNLVMFDQATGSFWSQILARAICGPLTGETLEILPASVATWGNWRESHPDTDVLLPPPHSKLMDLPG